MTLRPFALALLIAGTATAQTSQTAGPDLNAVPLTAQPATMPAATPGTQDVPGLKRREEQIQTLQATARLVVVDVVVTDSGGHAVKGLKAADFTLLEDGTPQKLSGFVEHSRISPERAALLASELKLPPNTFSDYVPAAMDDIGSIVFLLDAIDTPIQAQMYLRQQMIAYIQQMIAYMKTVPAGTKIAIFQLDTQMHMVQGFSSDPAVLLAAVNSKRDSPKISPLLGGPYAPGEVRERLRREVLTQGMQGLGKYLGGFPGRKSLIWFTGSVPISLYGPGIGVPFADESSFIDEIAKTTDVLTLSQVAVYPVDSRGLQTDPRFSAANGGGSGRGGGGGGFFAQSLQHGDLDDVAETTGGKAFYNTNGLQQAMAEVADQANNYYTLSFNPTNRQFDGRFRKLKVQLAQQGLHLEYRRGYFARNDDQELAEHRARRQNHAGPLTLPAVGGAPVSPMEIAMGMGAPAPHDVIFHAKVTPAPGTLKASNVTPLEQDNFLEKRFRKEPYRNYAIHFTVNPDTLRLTPTVDGSYHGRVDFVAIVYDDQGMKVNSIVAKASIDASPAEYQAIQRGGLGVTKSIAIPAKGNFFLRVGVDDVAGGKVGALEVPVAQIALNPQTAKASQP